MKDGDGASMKAFAQRDAFIQLGVDMTMVYGKRNGRTIDYYADGEHLLSDVQIRHLFFSNVLYSRLLELIKAKKYEILYIRYAQNASRPFLIFLEKCKKNGCKIYLEIPTYPYDSELNFNYSFGTIKNRILLFIERMNRRKLINCVYRIVTTSSYESIYGIPTIQISNAVSQIPSLHRKDPYDSQFTMISVSTIAFWHGLDRLIEGIYNYNNSSSNKVQLFIVGGGDEYEINKLKGLTERYKLWDSIFFTGPLVGQELDKIFSKSDVAIGCLGCHRKNIDEVKSLKNVEYAMRGIPFVYSEKNNDFDSKEYVLKVPYDDSPISVKDIISFVNKVKLSPECIRDSAKDFTWDFQLRKVVETFQI